MHGSGSPGGEGREPGRGPGRRRHRGRKEHVLHARISEQLARDVRRMAEELRVPVSNLVRTVLEEAVSAVESLSGSVGELFEEVAGEAERVREGLERRRARRERPSGAEAEGAAGAAAASQGPREADFADVLGWQPLVLHRAQTCADCGAGLPRGSRAFAAVSERGPGSAVLCRDCLDALG